MSSSSTAVFGNAAIAVNAIEKACSKIHQNLLLCQGLANIMDGSGNIADLGPDGLGNTVELLKSIATMLNYLDGRGWIDILAGSGNNEVRVVIKLPYNTNLQNSQLMSIYEFIMPSSLFRESSTLGTVLTYSNVPAGTAGSDQWCVNTKENLYAVNPSDYISALINLQQGFENITDMMAALAVINA